MDKRTAMNNIKFLDEVPLKGHKQREAMNEVCDALLEIVNATPIKNPKEDDGKTDPK